MAEPVRGADARRKQILLHHHAEILRHRSEPADLHHVRVQVVALEAPVRSRRNGKIFVARAERDRHLRAHLPLIADVEAVLPAPRRVRRHVQLQAADARWQAEQERREALEVIGAGAPELSRAGVELEPTPGPEAVVRDLRLNVVQRRVVQVRSESDVVLALRPVHIADRLVLVVGPVIRHEVLDRAEVGVPIEIEKRRAALPTVRPVRPRNAEPVAPLVLADIRHLDVAVHPHPAEVAVDHDIRPQCVRHAGREVVCVPPTAPRIPAAGRIVALQLGPEDRFAVLHEGELRVTAEDLQTLGRVPVHLRVERPPVEEEPRLNEIVVEVAGQVRLRKEWDDLLRDRADAILRNDVAGKGRPSAAVRVSRQRIVDRRAGAGKIAAPHRLGRHRNGSRHVPVLPCALIGRKKEHLVLADRAAQRAAELVLAPLAFGGARRREVVLRSHLLVEVVFVRRPAQCVRAALDLHVDGGATRQPLLGIEVVRDHVHRLDRFERWNVRHHVRQPDIRGAHAVDARVVALVTGAVDVEGERAGGVRRDRVRILRR